MPGMTRILVAYASSHGQTRAIADRIADRLRERGHRVATADAAHELPPPSGYDAVVLGSRVQLGKHARSITHYVERHRDELAGMPTAFFSVSNSAAQASAGPDANGYLATFFAKTRWRPAHAAAFGGALKYRSYGWLLRLVMKRISRAGGHPTDTSRDHDLTDWKAVDALADTFAAALEQDRRVGRRG